MIKLPLYKTGHSYKLDEHEVGILGKKYRIGADIVHAHLECIRKQMLKGYYKAASREQARYLVEQFFEDYVARDNL